MVLVLGHGPPRDGHRSHTSIRPVGLAGLAAVIVSALLLVVDARSTSQVSGLIAFTRSDGIYVMRSDGSGVRAIRRGGVASGAIGLAWSPDGRRIAFTDMRQIWVMDADGTHLVCVDRVDDGRTAVGPPAWSPDGRWIAFSASSHEASTDTWKRDVWVVRSDGGKVRRLVEAPQRLGVLDVAWSPTGNRLAVTLDPWFPNLYVMNTDGTHLRVLTPGFTATSPAWSPHGGKIGISHVLPNTSGSEWGIWLVDVRTGSRQRLLRGSSEPAKYPTWSPDGRMIAFVRGDGDWARILNSPPPASSPAEIYVMRADGSGLKRLTHNRVGEGDPAWQPGVLP